MNVKKVLLRDYSSLKIGGEGNLVIVKTENELKEACNYAKENNLKLHVIGEGTNTVFGDNLSKYLFIKNEIKGIEFKPSAISHQLSAGSGENWDDLVKYTVENNWWGIENLSNIPGTVGAAPVQNIGAYGVELKDVLVSLRAYDTTNNEFVELPNEQCQFGYRDSIFKHEVEQYIIVSVIIKLSTQPKPVLTYKPLDTLSPKDCTLQNIRDLVIKIRQEKLPDYKIYPNVGSFFKNPVVDKTKAENLKIKFPNIPFYEVEEGYKIPSAWLIEYVAQMKGLRVGDVGTWPTQPLVIVNYGNATYEELKNFTELIIKKIENETEIKLEREVNFIG